MSRESTRTTEARLALVGDMASEPPIDELSFPEQAHDEPPPESSPHNGLPHDEPSQDEPSHGGSAGGGPPDGGPPEDGPPENDGGFGELIASHRPRLYQRALRLSGNSDTAKDLVQETLLRAWQRRARFQIGTHLETWLVTILTNLFFDQIKHRNVVRKAEPDLTALAPVDCDLEGNVELMRASDDELRNAIAALEPDLRGLVELCYLHDMRYRDAAAKLGLPQGTVSTRLMRARLRLRELLTNSRKGKP